MDYFKKYEELKLKEDYRFGLAQQFISELTSLPPKMKYDLLPLFKKIEEEAFADNIKIPNLDYSKIVQEKKLWEISQISPTKLGKKKITGEDDFNKTLFNFLSEYTNIFNKIKGYFLFKLDNIIDADTKIIILFDEEFSKHPEINSFNFQDEYLKLQKYSLKDFSELANTDSAIKNQNYLCIIFITSNLRNDEIVYPNLKNLFELFERQNFISLKKIPLTDISDYEIKDVNDGIELIKSYSNKIFNNRALSFDEEIIIKSLFKGSEMVLDYKFLKSGNSGSKVIEIQPSRGNYPQMGRFVIKFSKKDSERKIRKEHDLFKEFISQLLIPNHFSEYEETLSYEAIRYNYASSDSKKDSYQFSELLNEYIKGEYDHKYSLQDVIDELFGCIPYQFWNTTVNQINEPVKILYDRYIKSEAKVFKYYSLIKHIDEKLIVKEKLIKNYNIIKNYSLKTNKKICHGDLHSENFFKDEKGVYLIDFGWTGRHHSLIDYVTLECSLKFKHLPFYIPLVELTTYENLFLSFDSFSKNFDLSICKREIVKSIYSLIVHIREKAKEYMLDKLCPLEYLIALFIISFRQIQYPGLNQNYAILSTEILSEEILKLISNNAH